LVFDKPPNREKKYVEHLPRRDEWENLPGDIRVVAAKENLTGKPNIYREHSRAVLSDEETLQTFIDSVEVGFMFKSHKVVFPTNLDPLTVPGTTFLKWMFCADNSFTSSSEIRTRSFKFYQHVEIGPSQMFRHDIIQIGWNEHPLGVEYDDEWTLLRCENFVVNMPFNIRQELESQKILGPPFFFPVRNVRNVQAGKSEVNISCEATYTESSTATKTMSIVKKNVVFDGDEKTTTSSSQVWTQSKKFQMTVKMTLSRRLKTYQELTKTYSDWQISIVENRGNSFLSHMNNEPQRKKFTLEDLRKPKKTKIEKEIAKFQRQIVELQANTKKMQSKVQSMQLLELEKVITDFQNEDVGFNFEDYTKMNWQDAMTLAITQGIINFNDNKIQICGGSVALPRTWRKNMDPDIGNLLTVTNNFSTGSFDDDTRRIIRDFQHVVAREKRLIVLYREKIECLSGRIPSVGQEKTPVKRKVNHLDIDNAMAEIMKKRNLF
jgi:hypothetical protein